MKETRTRSIVKAVSWRIIATATTIVAAWFVTKDIEVALGIGGIDALAKMVIYYFHERGWGSIQWGAEKC